MIIVVKRTLSTQLMLARTHLQRVRAGVKAVLASLPLLGITWSFGLLSFNSDTVYFKYLFAIFNSLQGLMIFVFHCVLNRKVRTVKVRPQSICVHYTRNEHRLGCIFCYILVQTPKVVRFKLQDGKQLQSTLSKWTSQTVSDIVYLFIYLFI